MAGPSPSDPRHQDFRFARDDPLPNNAHRQVTLPIWWPLPDGEEIGEERTGELVRWLRQVAPAAVVGARDYLRARNPNVAISTYAVPARLLARQALVPGMRGLAIGSVSVSACSGAQNSVWIALQRDGRLALTIQHDIRSKAELPSTGAGHPPARCRQDEAETFVDGRRGFHAPLHNDPLRRHLRHVIPRHGTPIRI